MTPYFLRSRSGEALMGYSDVLDGKEALDRADAGTELVRASDGVVLARRDSTSPMNFPTPHWGKRAL